MVLILSGILSACSPSFETVPQEVQTESANQDLPPLIAEPATNLNWVETSPATRRGVSASWTPSVTVLVQSQSVSFYSDDHCGTSFGSSVDLPSALTSSYALTLDDGQTYTYRISTRSLTGQVTTSPCSSPLMISILAPNTPAALSCVLAPVPASVGNVCTLTPADPADPNGEAVTYADAGSTCMSVIVASASGNATFTAPLKGATCVVKVKANNGFHDSAAVSSATITGANRAPSTPTALSCATSPVAGSTGNTCTLTAAAIPDADGDSVTYFQDASTTCPSTSVSTDGATITFTAPAKGATCIVTVKAYDSTAYSVPVTSATITAANTPPAVPQNISCTASPLGGSTGNTCTLTPAGTPDADGDSVTYLKEDSTTCPSTSVSANGATITFTAPAQGATCVVAVKAYDGTAYSSPVTSATITGQNNAPNQPAISCDTTPLGGSTGNTCALTAATPTDPDAESVSYLDNDSTCADTVVSIITGAVTFTAPAKAATCVIKVRAYDGTAYSTTVTSSTITGQNNPPNAPAAVLCETSPAAGSAGNTCTLTAATPTDADSDSVTYVDDGSDCPSTVVNETTGAATFTAPAGGASCIVKVKAYDGAAYSSIVSSSTITAIVPVTLGVSPLTADFGNVPRGGTSAATAFTISNTGGTGASTCSPALAGANSSDFLISSTDCTASLAAGASCTVNVKAKPQIAEALTATLSFGCAETTGVTTANALTVTGTETTFASDTTITGANLATYENKAWVIPNGVTVTIALNQTITISWLEIQGTGKLTHQVCDTTDCYKVDLTIEGSASIASGASIAANGVGYLGGFQGANAVATGRTNGNTNIGGSPYQAGASHGGYGGRFNSSYFPNALYGDPLAPQAHGSGGGGLSALNNGGNGGGVIRINVGGALILNGTISSNGAPGTSSSSSGGAGGSVYVQAGILSSTGGSPRLQAIGGNATNYGGAGGGRVALYYTALGAGFTPSAATMQAYGGSNSTTFHGGAGSVYWKPAGSSGTLLFDNNNIASNYGETELLLPNALTVQDLTVDRRAIIKQETVAYRLDVAGALTIQNNGKMYIPDDGNSTAGTFGEAMTWTGQKTWFTYIPGSSVGIIEASTLVEYAAPVSYSFTITDANFGTYQNTDWFVGPGDQIIMQVSSANLPLAINSLTVNGVLTHVGCDTVTCYSIDLAVTGNAMISAQARISADGLGYLGGNQGANASDYGRTYGNTTTNGSDYWAGASHGGYGGRFSSSYTPNALYGNPLAPQTHGSGAGGLDANNRGGNGGGVIHLNAGGTLTLNGTVSANGGNNIGSNSSGGAGGSVYIQAGTIASTAGSPKLQANGGAASVVSGGGGGRVALYYATLGEGFTPGTTTMQAYGGSGASSYHGGAGSVYWKPAATNGTLLYDNNNLVGNYGQTDMLLPNSIDLLDFIIDHKANVRLETVNTAVHITGTLSILNNGTLSIPDDGGIGSVGIASSTFFPMSNFFTYAAGNGVAPGTNLTEYYSQLNFLTIDDGNFANYQDTNWVVGPGDVITFKVSPDNLPLRASSLTVNGGTLTHEGCDTATCYKLDLSVTNDATISALGKISADGRGFLGAYQGANAAVARTLGNTTVGGSSSSSGGSHGGYGGRSTTGTPNALYGNLLLPVSHGSGGGCFNNSKKGGNGGGIIHLSVGGTLTLNGTVSSNGAAGSTGGLSAGGAGGSVYVQAGTMASAAGTPMLQANGGASTGYGSGGGGRVALYYTNLCAGFAPSVTTIQAYGGANSAAFYGGAGSVYWMQSGVSDTLLYDNNALLGSYLMTNIIPVEDLTVENLIIDHNARVKQDSSAYTLSIPGTLTIQNSGTLSVPTNTDVGFGAWFNYSSEVGVGIGTNLLEY
ncbi:MAG: hypothetical protein A2X97_05160 [Bdellovibrionales bacterium GWA1_52_35]|nr:MAG: hypothetical protein A2X97_05160 [Bdellovibrionales bacterium GWA1_52_35]